MHYVEAIKNATRKKAICNFMPMQPSDGPSTCANVEKLKENFGYCPTTKVDEGVAKIVEWYGQYYL